MSLLRTRSSLRPFNAEPPGRKQAGATAGERYHPVEDNIFVFRHFCQQRVGKSCNCSASSGSGNQRWNTVNRRTGCAARRQHVCLLFIIQKYHSLSLRFCSGVWFMWRPAKSRATDCSVACFHLTAAMLMCLMSRLVRVPLR
jgi:hypothetical protein